MGSVNLLNGGLDVQSIVDQLIYVEEEPIRQMQSRTDTFQQKSSAYQSFNTSLLALKTSAEGLLFKDADVPLLMPSSFEDRLKESVFALGKASSSDETVLTATADKGAVTGNYSVSVSQLAATDSYASGNFASTTETLTGTGTLTIQKGTDDPVTITIDDTNNTLAGIAAAINDQNAGFTAGIINDGSANPYRLVITSDDSGTANALAITSSLTGGTGQAVDFTQTVAARDALLQINGIDITSSSNAVQDAIAGVTLNLKAATGTALVTVEHDQDAIVEGVEDFISKYNDVVSFISSQFRYDSTKKQAGILAGDSTLRQTQSELTSTLMQSIDPGGEGPALLSQIGIKLGRDGKLTLDETKFRDALASDFTAAAHVFLADTLDAAGNPSSILPQLQSRLKSITDPLSGPVHSASDAMQKNIDRIQDRIEEMQQRIDMRREILTAQFSRADQALRELSVMQSSLSGQVNSLQSFV